jgi:hypothetical protein
LASASGEGEAEAGQHHRPSRKGGCGVKQYCRYCIHCHTGNGNWCDAKEQEFSNAYFKRVNNCKLFDFCEIDAFMENPNPYRPREPYKHNEHSDMPENLSLFKEDTQ